MLKNQQYKKGPLDFFAETISGKKTDAADLPSAAFGKAKAEKEETSFADQTAQKALFCEYIREHFNCFTEKKRETVLDYEMEYILGGKKNDRDNLSHVVTELVLLRIGMNMRVTIWLWHMFRVSIV